MTHKAREAGRRAEERVFQLAQNLGNATMATPEQDYGKKIDVIFEGCSIQVSVSLKSNKQRELLERRGIVNIPAGEKIEDFAIIALLKDLIGKK